MNRDYGRTKTLRCLVIIQELSCANKIEEFIPIFYFKFYENIPILFYTKSLHFLEGSIEIFFQTIG